MTETQASNIPNDPAHGEKVVPPSPPHPAPVSAPTPDTIASEVVAPMPAEPVPADQLSGPVTLDQTAEPSPSVPPFKPERAELHEPPVARSLAAEQVRGTPLWLTGVVAVVLLIGLFLLWKDLEAASGGSRIAALESELKAAQAQIATLQQRPAPDTGRISALEAKVQALSNRPAPDTSGLEGRLAALENKPAPAIPDVAGAVASASADLNAKIASLDSKMQSDIAQTTARSALAARLRTATVALDSGQPLGDIPGAPATVSRFAQQAPPTEPALRLSFARYAGAAEAASRPSAAGHDFAERMWMRAQQLVTVRQGDKVLVGAPAAVTLAAARGRLEAGDLAGAVAALGPLDPAATASMAPWKSDAQALLDARAGLASLAAKS